MLLIESFLLRRNRWQNFREREREGKTEVEYFRHNLFLSLAINNENNQSPKSSHIIIV